MLQGDPFSVNEVGAELLLLHAPLKPGSELNDVPGAIVPLYERFVIVTFAPLWV